MVTQWKYVFGVHIRIYVSLSMFRQLDWGAAESGFKHEAPGVVASLPRRELSNEPMSSLKKSVLLGEVTDPRHGLECVGGQALPSNKFHALLGFGDLPVKADLFVEVHYWSNGRFLPCRWCRDTMGGSLSMPATTTCQSRWRNKLRPRPLTTLFHCMAKHPLTSVWTHGVSHQEAVTMSAMGAWRKMYCSVYGGVIARKVA